jgi:hypothetical protein
MPPRPRREGQFCMQEVQTRQLKAYPGHFRHQDGGRPGGPPPRWRVSPGVRGFPLIRRVHGTDGHAVAHFMHLARASATPSRES